MNNPTTPNQLIETKIISLNNFSQSETLKEKSRLVEKIIATESLIKTIDELAATYFGKRDSESLNSYMKLMNEAKQNEDLVLSFKAELKSIQDSEKVTTKVGQTNYYPEMDGKKPDAQIEAKLSYGGGYYISTKLDLKGRGIKQSGDGSDHKRGLKTYHTTKLAYQKLKEQYSISFECLLD